MLFLECLMSRSGLRLLHSMWLFRGTKEDFISCFVFKFLQCYMCIVSAVLHVGRALFAFSPQLLKLSLLISKLMEGLPILEED